MKTESTIESICADAELARLNKVDHQLERNAQWIQQLRRHKAEGWILDGRDQLLLDRADGVVR